MFEKYWIIACRTKDLGKKPKRLKLFGRYFVAFRSEKGAPQLLEDRCPHRNAPLSSGRVVNGQIECPYHGWKFNGQGTLTHLPATESSNHACSVPSFPSVEQEGYIWVCLSRHPVQPNPPRFAHVNEKGWTTFRMKTEFQSPVDSCLENFLDCPHATTVHRYWFRAPTSEKVICQVEALSDGAVVRYQHEPRKKSAVWWLLSRSRSQMTHTDRFIAPATSRVDYEFSDGRTYIITSSCTPVDDNHTTVHTVMTFRFPFIGWLVRLFFEPLSRIIIRQDVNILNKQQANIDAFGEGRRYHAIEQDLLWPHIQRWRQAIAQGRTKPEENPRREPEVNLYL